MSRYIIELPNKMKIDVDKHKGEMAMGVFVGEVVMCKDCRKSHIDGKTTHYLWCTEWGRSTDTFGYCERGEREGE